MKIKNKVYFSEIREIKNKKHKEGHFYKRKDGDYTLVLPYKPEIGLKPGNVIKFFFKGKNLGLKVYEPCIKNDKDD